MSEIDVYIKMSNLMIFCKEGKTLLEISKHMQVSLRTAQRYVKSLIEKGWLERNGLAIQSTGTLEKNIFEGTSL